MNFFNLKQYFLFLFFIPSLLFSASQLEKISLQLSWMHQFEYAGFYAAKHKGYYKDVGLDVSFKEMNFKRKDHVIEDILTGKSTYAIDYSSIIRSYLSGQPIVFVANFFKHSPLVLATQKDIVMPSDLEGKKFMGGNDALSNTAMFIMLKQFNITKDSFIDVPQTFKMDDFINKKVDATTIFLTNQAYLLNKIAYEYNILNPQNYGAEFYVDNLFTSRSEVLNHPKRVKNFKEATIKGWQYALENKEEIVDLILKEYNTQNKTKEQLLFEARQTEDLMLSHVYPIGSIDTSRVKRIAETYIQLGLVNKNAKMNIDEFVFEPKSKDVFLSNQEKKYLFRKKLLRVCIDPNWMPFEQINDKGIHRGISSDYFRLFRKQLPIPIVLVDTKSWSESIEGIKTNKCDILSIASKNKNREEYLNFTSSYLSSPLVLATKNNIPFIDDLRTIENRKVAIVEGYGFLDSIKQKYPYLNIVTVKNVDEGLKKVSSGEIFGFIGTLATVTYKFQKQYVGELKIAAKFDEKLDFSVALRNDEPLLLDIFEKLVSSIDKQQRQTIFNKYVSISFESRKDYTLLITSLVISFIIIMIIMFWNRKLHLEKLKTQKALENLRIAEKLLEKRNLELKKISVTDKLTKVFNREKLDNEIRKELFRSERTKEKFSIIMLDIDYFKSVNDSFGHQVGDDVLVEFASIIQNHIRRIDTLGRWGGEEFIIICPNTSKNGAIKMADDIRKLVEAHNFPILGKKTASFGVTTYQESDNENSIIHRVDMAMYQAKNNGRNKVVFFS